MWGPRTQRLHTCLLGSRQHVRHGSAGKHRSEEKTASISVRCTRGVREAAASCRRQRSYVRKATQGERSSSLGLGQGLQALAHTQRPPAGLGTVPCVGSGFWDKRNRMKDDECVEAAMKHEKGKSEQRNLLTRGHHANKPVGKTHLTVNIRWHCLS